MAAKVFTEEQRKILSKNPNVESVEKTRIIYTEAFKSYYVKNYLAGKKPTEIFIEAGFDPSILGNKRIERASARWRKLYADGQLIIDTKENISVETKEEKTDGLLGGMLFHVKSHVSFTHSSESSLLYKIFCAIL